VVDTLKAKKIALIGDTTAYGQGGYNLLKEFLKSLALAGPRRIRRARRQGHELHNRQDQGCGRGRAGIHGVDQPMALLMKQSRAAGLDIPIVDSSSIVERRRRLVRAGGLKNTCAETASARNTANAEIAAWATLTRAVNEEPDSLALGQYDAS